MAKFYYQEREASSFQPVNTFYFAYGMNTNIKGMANRCPDAICLGHGTIRNFKLAFHSHADIEHLHNNILHGVVWKITQSCEYQLDVLEGYPLYYIKRDFVVELEKPYNDMTHVKAMAYLMTEPGEYSPPSEWYKECLLEGYAENGVPTEQIYRAIEESYARQPQT